MKSLILTSILAGLVIMPAAQATVIYVSGDQTGTWSADTVIVTAEVRVPPGQSLTILPGVEVLFSVYCKLIVDHGAMLRAAGTSADSIRFDVLPPDTAWHGIRFLSASDSSRLEYCLLTNGSASGGGEDDNGGAIYCSSASPTISSSTLSGNSASAFGGGIYCYSSSPSIHDNTISRNSAASGGGGITCYYSSPTISGNTISGNSVTSAYYSGGGGIRCDNSSPSISGNTISGNSVTGGTYPCGGGIACDYYSSPSIRGNTIGGNSATNGGGIFCEYFSSPTISGNTISDNSASHGGGICCYPYSSPSIRGNTISENSAGMGGGIFCYSSSPIISGNTIAQNSTTGGGGGICCVYNSSPTLVNCILWGNSRPEIFQTSGSNLQATYCNIQDTLWWGAGNISASPAFVDTAQSDYRLQWGSPCIDTGDPNPIYDDPDGTRADMGAWYYDQSMPVRILLTPYRAPIQIPAAGGSFQYAIQATNIDSVTLSALVWCDVTLPSGTIYGPVLDPVTISLAAGQTISHLRRQDIPARAPAGIYDYNAYAVAVGDTSEDSFTFTKLGAGNWELGAGDWANTGETFETANAGEEGIYPLSFSLYPSFPNPFNPSTVLSYQLPVASHASLRIFDTAGRLVRELVNGWRAAGAHEVTFNGSGLPSGIYFAKLCAREFSQTQKLVLLK